MCKSKVKAGRLTVSSAFETIYLSVSGGTGIPGVAVECVDIGRNTSGEGGYLGHN